MIPPGTPLVMGGGYAPHTPCGGGGTKTVPPPHCGAVKALWLLLQAVPRPRCLSSRCDEVYRAGDYFDGHIVPFSRIPGEC